MHEFVSDSLWLYRGPGACQQYCDEYHDCYRTSHHVGATEMDRISPARFSNHWHIHEPKYFAHSLAFKYQPTHYRRGDFITHKQA